MGPIRFALVGLTIAATLAPAAAWAAAKTCLTGTDPSVAGDLAQITVLRTAIDRACVCASFDGSVGKTHGDYVKCAKTTIAASVTAGTLRTQCKGTVTKYYSTSTCGFPASQGKQPCVKKTLSNGKVTCKIKPAAKCVSKAGKYDQTPCGTETLCISAADSNHDGLLSAADSGMCVVAPTQIPTSASTPTRTPTPGPVLGCCGVPGVTCVTQQVTAGGCASVNSGPVLPGLWTFNPGQSCFVGATISCVGGAATPTPQRFVDNGNGTITDTQSGLMWEKKDDFVPGGLHDKDSLFTWSDTFDWVSILNVPPCFAGHCDWRIPSDNELLTILNDAVPGCHSGSPCVSPEFNSNCTPGCTVAGCSCTALTHYWSATTVSNDPNAAFAVGFDTASICNCSKISHYAVRAVRP